MVIERAGVIDWFQHVAGAANNGGGICPRPAVPACTIWAATMAPRATSRASSTGLLIARP